MLKACWVPPPLWSYVSLGCWRTTQQEGHGLELLLMGDRACDRPAELTTVVADYHAGPADQRLDLGHTVRLGEPWLPGSACEHLLVSLPYPYGPDFEIAVWGGSHARVLWLLPITEAERDLKVAEGLEALEQRFEDAELHYWDAERPSVV